MTDQSRASALEQIRTLMQQHELSVADVAAAVQPGTDTSSRSALLIKVLSYIGGIFIFSGIAAFVALQWGEMNSMARVTITLGSGLVLFVLSLLALDDARYHSAAVPLMLGAAALEPVGIMVALQEFGGGGDEQVAALLTAGVVAIQFALAFVRYRLTTMILITILFGSASWGLALDLLDLDSELIMLTLGLAWLLLGLQFHRGVHAIVSPLLFFFGCWVFLWGLFELVEDSVLELLFLLAACGMTYLGVWARSRSLNFASTAGILTYTAYFTGKHFADSVGWPIALIVIGLLMLGIGALALRIDRKYLRST